MSAIGPLPPPDSVMSCVVVVAVMAPSARRTRVGSSCFHASPTRLRLGTALWLSRICPSGKRGQGLRRGAGGGRLDLLAGPLGLGQRRVDPEWLRRDGGRVSAGRGGGSGGRCGERDRGRGDGDGGHRPDATARRRSRPLIMRSTPRE